MIMNLNNLSFLFHKYVYETFYAAASLGVENVLLELYKLCIFMLFFLFNILLII